MSSLFTRIIAGEIPSHRIAESETCYAFLDIFPLAKGHTLVIPKQEVDYIFDLDDETLAELHLFSKKVARAIEQVIPCARIGTAVVGLEVPHAHIHLVPINEIGDLNFSKEKLDMTQEELAAVAQQINASFSELYPDFR